MSTTGNVNARAFIEQDILSKTPAQLILVAYDLGIKGCRRKDRELVRGVLTELIAALDFSQPVAGNFLALYDYALREVRENRFEEPEKILSGLRDVWHTALGGGATGNEPAVESQLAGAGGR